MSSALPRGITIVRWKNKKTRTPEIRYHVRIKRKGFYVNKLFRTLDKAKQHLFQVEQAMLNRRNQPERRAPEPEPDMQEPEPGTTLFREFHSNPPLRKIIDKYLEQFIFPKLRPDTAEASKSTYKALARSICRTKVGMYQIKNPALKINEAGDKVFDYSRMTAVEEGTAESILTEVIGDHWIGSLHDRRESALYQGYAVYERIGDLSLDQITRDTIEEYINERLNPSDGRKPCKPITVQRQINLLSAVYNPKKLGKLHTIAARLNGKNPVKDADKEILRGAWEPRDVRFTQVHEDALVTQLKKFDNQEMLHVFYLALETGMRRGEILRLRREQIVDNEIHLKASDTKTKKARKVPLTRNAQRRIKTILNSIPAKQERLFTYTYEGYKSNWERVVKRAGLKDFHFHDLRHVFISRLLDQSLPGFAIQRFAGIKDPLHFEKHRKVHDDRKVRENFENTVLTRQQVGKVTGQNTLRITDAYTTPDRKLMSKVEIGKIRPTKKKRS